MEIGLLEWKTSKSYDIKKTRDLLQQELKQNGMFFHFLVLEYI